MYRSSAQMYPVVQAYLTGIKTKNDICNENEIPLHVFQYWLKKYQSTDEDELEGFATLQVEQTAQGGNISIYLPNGTRIEIPLQ
jgi:transposase-like protein